MMTLASVFAISFMSPVVFILGLSNLLYSCNTPTLANITNITPNDAVTCNATLYLPAYKTTAHVHMPCMHVLRCLPQYQVQDPVSSQCQNLLVLTNHYYQHNSCIKPVIDPQQQTYLHHETVETIMGTTVAALVIVLSLVAIVTSSEPMSYPL